MNRDFAAVVGIAAVLALAGCTGGTPATTGPSGSTTTAAQATPSAPVSSTPALRSTAPNGEKTLPTPRESTRPPVRWTQTSRIENHAMAEIVEIRAITIEASEPGGASGPGLAITLKITNIGDAPFDTTRTLVTLAGSDNSPGIETSGPPSKPLTEEVSPEKSTTGVYTFTLPTTKRSQITIRVTLPTESPVMVFSGPAPE